MTCPSHGINLNVHVCMNFMCMYTQLCKMWTPQKGIIFQKLFNINRFADELKLILLFGFS